MVEQGGMAVPKFAVSFNSLSSRASDSELKETAKLVPR